MMLEGREGRRVQQFEIVTMINRLGIVYLGLRATIRTRFKALDRCALLPLSFSLSSECDDDTVPLLSRGKTKRTRDNPFSYDTRGRDVLREFSSEWKTISPASFPLPAREWEIGEIENFVRSFVRCLRIYGHFVRKFK